jgi:hypothetical protein
MVMLHADHDDEASLQFHSIDNVLGPATPPGLADREMEEHLLLASKAELVTLEEALRYENWCLAMRMNLLQLRTTTPGLLLIHRSECVQSTSSGFTKPREMRLDLFASTKAD